MSGTSDGTKGTGYFQCPCITCIVTEARKHEERKQFHEADLIMKNGLQYYSTIVKKLEEELKKFHVRTKYNTSDSTVSKDVVSSSYRTQELVQFTHCQHSTHRLVANTKEFTCSVAIFDQNPDPKQKPMYPKNVVYLDGNDHQLEEISAARYWTNRLSKSSLEHEKISDNLRRIMSSEEFISFTEKKKISAEELGKNPVDITNRIEHVPSSITKSKLPQCSAENENIDPSAPEILESIKNLTESLPKITSEKHSVSTLLNKSSSNTLTILNNVARASSSPAKNRISCTSKTTEEISALPDRNQTFTLKNIEKTDTSKRNIQTNLRDPILILPGTIVSNESTMCNSSEDARLRNRISPTITHMNLKMRDDESNFEKASSIINASEQPLCRDKHERSKIPTIKRVTPNMEQLQRGASHQKAVAKTVCSETFIVSKQNPSETFVTKPFDIDKVMLTLVQDDDDDDDDDDFVSCTLNKRSSELLKPPDEDLSAAEVFPVELPCSSLSRRSTKSADINSSTTEAFHIALPSSTPNKRMSQFFKTSTADTNENVGSMALSAPLANLSTITEMSKEHYSSSSRPSQKTPLETINEAERSDDCSKSDSVEVIPDPFDVDLIESLLQKIQFPRPEHADGYNQINSDMAQMKLSSVVKLGSSKYNIIGEIGKGSYARILKLQNVREPSQSIALKQQKPACPWEFYISKEIQRRLRTNLERSYFIQYTEIFVYQNGSVMVSQWAPYGSILNFVNSLKSSPYHNNRCPIAVVIWLSIQFMEAIQYLHSCNIIHGDVKPDNFVLYDEIATDRASVKLIDYGRAIDMSLLPKGVTFNKVVITEDYTCNEMKDNRPWTYQTDIFGLASTIYLLLVGEYMKTKKEVTKKWTLQKNFPRYINRDMWNPIFDQLLNVPSCTELPDLVAMRRTLEADFNSLDRQTITQQFTNIGTLLRK